MTAGELISDEEKVSIASNFILHAPPGELNEVFNDVKVLLNDNALLNEVASTVSQYNKSQLTRVKIEHVSHPCLITEYNDLGNGKFFDSRSKTSFKYDHLRREASECSGWEPDAAADSWRVALESALDAYVLDHYSTGVCSVFAKKEGSAIILSACIEGHQFSPKNYWNGQWMSKWSVVIENGSSKVEGNLKVQVHYFEEGNVQLLGSKEVKEELAVSNEDQLAVDLIKLIEESESHYHKAVCNNFSSLSITFKALRRQLPLARTKMDWGKLVSYGLKHELTKMPKL